MMSEKEYRNVLGESYDVLMDHLTFNNDEKEYDGYFQYAVNYLNDKSDKKDAVQYLHEGWLYEDYKNDTSVHSKKAWDCDICFNMNVNGTIHLFVRYDDIIVYEIKEYMRHSDRTTPYDVFKWFYDYLTDNGEEHFRKHLEMFRINNGPLTQGNVS